MQDVTFFFSPKYTQALFVHLKQSTSSAAKSAYMRAHAGCNDETGRDSSVPEGWSAFVHSDGSFPGRRYRRISPLICLDEMSVRAWHTTAWQKLLDSPVGAKSTPKCLWPFFFFFPFQPRRQRPFLEPHTLFLEPARRLTFDLNKNAYLVALLQCWLRSHSDYRTLLSSSCDVWISTERPSTDHTPLPVQFSHSTSWAVKVSDCS